MYFSCNADEYKFIIFNKQYRIFLTLSTLTNIPLNLIKLCYCIKFFKFTSGWIGLLKNMSEIIS